MIRVLYTVNGLRVNGMSAVIMQYITKLDKHKYQFSVFTDEIDEKFIQTLNENHVEIYQSKMRRKNQLAYFMELCRILRTGKYDIVHAHGNSATIAVELLAARICGVPMRIAHSHNTTCDHIKLDRFLRPLFYTLYTDGIGCGIAAGKWLFQDHPFTVIKNGIDLDRYCFDQKQRDRIRTELGIENKFVIGHVGRFTDQKNHAFLLKAFRDLRKPDSVLLLVGDGPLEEQIKELAEKLKINNRVIFYGTTNDTAAMYSAMDCFVFPSKYEGVPLTLIESQANGLPCFISDRVSSEVILTDLIQVLSLDDPHRWAEEILVGKKRIPEDSKSAIRSLKEAGFGICEVIEQIDSLYQKNVI